LPYRRGHRKNPSRYNDSAKEIWPVHRYQTVLHDGADFLASRDRSEICEPGRSKAPEIRTEIGHADSSAMAFFRLILPLAEEMQSGLSLFDMQ
jgi:hypothetical protein